MNAAVCKECGFSFADKDPSKYFCPNYSKEILKVEAFYSAKPNELNEIN